MPSEMVSRIQIKILYLEQNFQASQAVNTPDLLWGLPKKFSLLVILLIVLIDFLDC